MFTLYCKIDANFKKAYHLVLLGVEPLALLGTYLLVLLGAELLAPLGAHLHVLLGAELIAPLGAHLLVVGVHPLEWLMEFLLLEKWLENLM